MFNSPAREKTNSVTACVRQDDIMTKREFVMKITIQTINTVYGNFKLWFITHYCRQSCPAPD